MVFHDFLDIAPKTNKTMQKEKQIKQWIKVKTFYTVDQSKTYTATNAINKKRKDNL
jgi:hypothetical protein